MNILFLCPRWGNAALPSSAFIQRVLEAGYDGIEAGLAEFDPAADESIRLAQAAGLALVTQHYDTLDRDLPTHLVKFESRLRMLARYQPLFINSHTGRDLFTLEENRRVFAVAEKVAAEVSLPIYHETHRARCCHSSWRTLELLKAQPATQFVLDISHWCNVSESLLEDQSDWIEPILPNVAHLHARVGWAQGPQVSDPRAPEWQAALEAHLTWWDKIIAQKRASGVATFTITPEFGPTPYLPTLPYSQQPVASPWEINVWMMNLLRQRYSSPPKRR